MNDCIKVIIFTSVLIFSAYDTICVTPVERKPVPFKSGGDASVSFISGESEPPRTKPNPIGTGIIDPIQISGLSTTKAPIRDYVNPLINPSQKPRDPFPALKPPGGPQNVGNLTPIPSSAGPGQPTTKAPLRDYVNPHINPSQRPTDPFPALKPPGGSQNVGNLTPIPSSVGPGQPTTKAPLRDYVNPHINPSQRPRDPFPALKPPGGSQNIGNPTSMASSGVSGQSSPKRDYANPQINPSQGPRDPYPALKTPGGPLNVITPKPAISYAQRTSGGVTTSRPRVGAVPSSGVMSSTGSPGDGTTRKPDDGPKDDELREFSEALLKRDVNNAYKYVTTNLQGKTTSHSKNDEAPQRLLQISKEAFDIPTIAKLRLLFNNYILDVTENEFVTPQEKAEENELLDAMITTPIMQFTKNFLIANGKVSKDPKDFKDLLKTIWFSMYSRGGGRVGSSGFEHIFVAEIKKGEVSGLHNWLYFSQAEENNQADYLGYMKKIDLGEKGAILKFHFTLNGTDKPVNSIFIGTSPELEMALYTTCYVFRANRVCPLRLAGNNFIIRAYSLKYRGKYLIGSAFPEI